MNAFVFDWASAGPEVLLVIVAAFLAGLIDAMVGGGGLVQLPALFSAFPQAAPAQLLGTSKLAGVFGTASAAWRYATHVRLPWKVLLPGAAVAFVASLAGAMTVSHVPPDLFRPLVPVLLTVVLVYTLWRKDLGRHHAPTTFTRRQQIAAGAMIAAIGYYDGFFGPGTGSFLMILFIRQFGFDFLHASASARVLNVATNVAALSWFGVRGEVLWLLGAGMAVANVAGAQTGTRLALRHGSGLVRVMFICVVSALIVKTGYDAYVVGVR